MCVPCLCRWCLQQLVALKPIMTRARSVPWCGCVWNLHACVWLAFCQLHLLTCLLGVYWTATCQTLSSRSRNIALSKWDASTCPWSFYSVFEDSRQVLTGRMRKRGRSCHEGREPATAGPSLGGLHRASWQRHVFRTASRAGITVPCAGASPPCHLSTCVKLAEFSTSCFWTYPQGGSYCHS